MALFNPFAIWTNFALKSGEAMLTAAQAAVAQRKAPTVAVLPTEDPPPPKVARKKAASRARRRRR